MNSKKPISVADILFDNLGYVKVYQGNDELVYQKEEEEGSYSVNFFLDSHTYMVNHFKKDVPFDKRILFAVDLNLHKAINTKIKELDW